MVPTNTEVIFARFITMRGKQILARAFEIQRENWDRVTTRFLEIIPQRLFQEAVKYKETYGVFFPN